MPARAAARDSPESSQSTLSSGPLSDDDGAKVQGRKMATQIRGKRVINDDDDEDEGTAGITADSLGEEEEEEDEMDAEGSEEDEEEGEEEDDEIVSGQEEEEEEEADELEDDEDEDAGAEVSTSRQARSSSRRSVPTRRAAATASRRNARSRAIASGSASDDEDAEGDEEEEEDMLATPASSSKGARRITLRITPNKAGQKRGPGRPPKAQRGGRASSSSTTRRGKGRPRGPGRPPSRKRGGYDDDDDDEEEEDEEAAAAAMDQDGEASSEDFENDNSFASLPKTARQLAKERAAQGIETPESEAPELADDGDGVGTALGLEGKKTKMTESELALKRSELARRRRNQTEKKLEDDKIETINRLLKKQVTRRSTRGGGGGGAGAGGRNGDGDDSDADNDDETDGRIDNGDKQTSSHHQPTRLELKQLPQPFFRYIDSAHGPSTLSLPIEVIEGQADGGPYKRKWEEMFGISNTALSAAQQ